MEKALRLAVAGNDWVKVQSLLEQRADPNANNNFQVPVLHLAVRKSHKVLELLLNAGAKPSVADRQDAMTCCLAQCSEPEHDSKANLLLHHGAVMSERTRRLQLFVPYNSTINTRMQNLTEAHDIMRERVARCRRVCIALFKAPFQERKLRTLWIRESIWSTRHDAVWTPDLEMPQGYN